MWVAVIYADGKYEGIKSLLRNKADTYHKNLHGRSPMYIAKNIITGLEDTFMPYVSGKVMCK